MRLIRLAAAFAVASMMAVPALAATANPAASLSLSGDEGGAAPAKHAGKTGGGSTLVILGVAAVAVVGGAVALGSHHHHHDNTPASS